MGINDVGTSNLNGTRNRTPTAPLNDPTAMPAAAGAAPAEAPRLARDAAATNPGNTDRLAAATAGMPSDLSFEQLLTGSKTGVEALKQSFAAMRFERGPNNAMSWADRSSFASSALATARSVVDAGDGLQQLADGQYVEGGLQTSRAAADVVSSSLKAHQAYTGSDRFKGLTVDAKTVSAGLGGAQNAVLGFQELQDGQYLAGGAHLTGGVLGMGGAAATSVAGRVLQEATRQGQAAGLVGDALEGFKRSQLQNSIGRFGAPMALAAGAINGGFRVAEGWQTLQSGDVGMGVAQMGQGALDTAAGMAFTANVLPTASRAIQTFGKAAGPLGAAAGIVGGGIQAYSGLQGDPPNYREAALGGAKMAGSALLLTPPPGNIAGGAILVGAALYENAEPVRQVVDGVVGGVAAYGEGVIDGYKEIGEGFVEAGAELAEGVQEARRELEAGNYAAAAGEVVEGVGDAAEDIGRNVVEAGERVAEGLSEGASRVGEGLANAGESVAGGLKSAGESVGNFMSSLF